MPLGTEVGLGPGDIVLDGDSALCTETGTAARHFSAYVLWSNDSPSSQQLLSSCVIITDHLEHSVECVYLSVCLCVRTAIFEEMTFRLDIYAGSSRLSQFLTWKFTVILMKNVPFPAIDARYQARRADRG